jgi:hypothetical protein
LKSLDKLVDRDDTRLILSRSSNTLDSLVNEEAAHMSGITDEEKKSLKKSSSARRVRGSTGPISIPPAPPMCDQNAVAGVALIVLRQG